MPGVQVWAVTKPEAGQKLLQFIIRRLSGAIPRSAVQRWIRTGQVRVNGARAKPGTRLELDQLVRVPPHDLPEPFKTGRSAGIWGDDRSLEVLFEDHDLLVLAKPKGLPVHAGTGHQDCLAARLHLRFADHPWKLTPVHRLDRDTTGLLIVAKSYSELQTLQDLWRDGKVAKTYLTWVQGRPGWDEAALLEDDLVKTAMPRGERMHVGTGKTCRTFVRILHQFEDAALTLVAPLTGRTHQIRVQLASRGFPLIGDVKYGGPASAQGMLLHAWHISWPGRTFHLLPDWSPPWSLPAEITLEQLSQATREMTRKLP